VNLWANVRDAVRSTETCADTPVINNGRRMITRFVNIGWSVCTRRCQQIHHPTSKDILYRRTMGKFTT